MKVPGTTVSVEDVEGGAAVAFRTTTGNVAELRRRVQHVAEMHSQHHGGRMSGGSGAASAGQRGGPGMMGAPHETMGTHGMMAMHGMMGMHGMMVPATATAEDAEGGGRIVLRPKDPADLGALRTHVHEHAERMQRGECPMMMMGHADGQSEERRGK